MTATAMLFTSGVPRSSLSERTTVVVIAAALHLVVFAAWLMQPPGAAMAQHVMEVTMAFVPAARPAPTPQPRKPELKPLPLAPVAQADEAPVALTSVPEPVVAAKPDIKTAEAEAPVTEPDYMASYLNNPPPSYPLAARRMGLQGKVVLNVEVLAEGVSGQVNVRQSSGHNMLDNSALRTVKSWRFIPARQAGRAITRWFKVPIQFSLKDNEA